MRAYASVSVTVKTRMGKTSRSRCRTEWIKPRAKAGISAYHTKVSGMVKGWRTPLMANGIRSEQKMDEPYRKGQQSPTRRRHVVTRAVGDFPHIA
jgi:hypothetical protein